MERGKQQHSSSSLQRGGQDPVSEGKNMLEIFEKSQIDRVVRLCLKKCVNDID